MSIDCINCENFRPTCKGCAAYKPISRYTQFCNMAKEYVVRGENRNFGIYTECSRLTREIYRHINPAYKGYTRIDNVINSDEDVDVLFEIFKKVADTYLEIVPEGKE